MAIPHFHFETVTSTQNKAFELAEEGQQPPFLVSCSVQEKGRGRMGRPWHMETGRSLAMTLLVNRKPFEFSGLSLVVGLGILEALKDPSLKLKWPNDLMLENKKVGGILIESRSQGQDVLTAIGIGINLFNQQFASWEGLNKNVNSEALAQTVYEFVLEFSHQGFSPFQKKFEARMWKKGERITFFNQDKEKKVKILGVSEKGYLKMEDQGEMKLTDQGELL